MRTIALILASLVITGCVHSYTLSDDVPTPAPAKKGRRAPAGRSSNPTDLCVRLVTSLGASYRALYAIGGGGVPLATTGASYAITKVSEADCAEERRARPLKLFAQELAENTGRVGVLLSQASQKSQAVLRGIEAAYVEGKRDYGKTVVVRDTKASPANAVAKLAELVFNHQVSMVLASVSAAEAQALAPWADKLDLPMIFLTREDSFLPKTRFAFRVFPDEKMIAEALAEAAKAKGFQRMALLVPDDGKATRLTEAFRASLKERKIEVATEATYTPNNFKTMDAAVRKIFNLDADSRRDEYKRLVKKEKQKAEEAHARFNPRSVFLKPEVEFDALFLPDDFRMLRHFVKLIQYNGVRHLPIIGNFEWRSTGLVEPPEPFLKDSFFADFIGSYDQLPAPLHREEIESPLFADPTTVKDIDFELVGYRAATIALAALGGSEVKRWRLVGVLENLKMKASGFFPADAPFTKEHNNRWPAFVFFLTEDGGDRATASEEE